VDAAEKFRLAIEMNELGIEIMRSNLRRRFPNATEDELKRLLHDWLHDRPPDAPGVVTNRFANQ
jgi:hypothetical protein